METTTSSFPSAADGLAISTTVWSPDTEPRGVVQLAHGVAEHSKRYERLARALTDAGYIVYINDHRGHGSSIGGDVSLGGFGAAGWPAVVDDLVAYSEAIAKSNLGLPLFLIAHSMGSFAAQQIILDRSDLYSAVVLTGSTALDLLAQGLAAAGDGPVELTAFNTAFENRTGYEWLSRDEAEVDAYVADPLSGFDLADDTVPQLFASADRLADPEALGGIRPDLPILIVSGDRDPVGATASCSRCSASAIATRASQTSQSLSTPTPATRCSTRSTATRSPPTSSPGSTPTSEDRPMSTPLPAPKPLDETGALIVGGTAGIGFASAKRLVEAGVPRVMLVARDPVRGGEARARLAASGADVTFVSADATRADEAERIATTAREVLGGIDLLVCSTVASSRPELFRDIPTAGISRMIDELLLPTLQIVSAVMPVMREQRQGAIVTVASDAGKTATPGETIIGACKAAVIMFTRTIAIEGKRDGIRANVVTPSLVLGTASSDRILSDGFSAKLFEKAALAASLGVPDADDIAELVAFLASPAAAKLTGQAVSVNGGISAA
ncbi:SDR family oxidoreductase [Microbacterium aurum]